jgi:hypothetical protein
VAVLQSPYGKKRQSVRAGRSSRNISIEIDVEPTIALEAVAGDIEDMNFVVAFRVDDAVWSSTRK